MLFPLLLPEGEVDPGLNRKHHSFFFPTLRGSEAELPRDSFRTVEPKNCHTGIQASIWD